MSATRKRAGRLGGRSARHTLRSQPLAVEKRPIWPGAEAGQYKPLTESQVVKIYDAALDVLATVGMGEVPDVVTEQAVSQGCTADENGRLFFPRSFVEDIVAGAARSVSLCGRDPKHDLDVSGKRVHFGTGGAAVNVVDFATNDYRASTLLDLFDFARMADALDNVHWFTRCVVATDVPDEFGLDVNTAYACLAGTRKHIGMSFVRGSHVRPIIDMFEHVTGGEGSFRKRPFCKVHISPVVSPLRYGEDAVGVTLAAIEENMPINCIIAAQSGATAPAPLAGVLVQTLAETLAGLILVNLFSPGYPVIFSNWPFVVDLRSGAFACGAAEIALLNAGAAQLANYLQLPSGVAGGMADSKIPDAQAAYEKAISLSATALAGANMVYESAGMYASLLGASFEGFVLDDDIVGMALRLARGIEVNDDTMSLAAIRDVVSGPNHFLSHPQTMASMETHYFYPEAADRDSPAVWMENGKQEVNALVRERARTILNGHYNPEFLPDHLDRDIRARHDILLPREAMTKGNRVF